jgi:hypothetical protein
LRHRYETKTKTTGAQTTYSHGENLPDASFGQMNDIRHLSASLVGYLYCGPFVRGASGDLGSLHLDRRAIVSVDLAKKVSLWNGGNVQVKAISRYH